MLCPSTICKQTKSDKVDPETQSKLDKGEKPSDIVQCQKPQSTDSTPFIDDLFRQISEESQNPAKTRANSITKLVNKLQSVQCVQQL